MVVGAQLPVPPADIRVKISASVFQASQVADGYLMDSIVYLRVYLCSIAFRLQAEPGKLCVLKIWSLTYKFCILMFGVCV